MTHATPAVVLAILLAMHRPSLPVQRCMSHHAASVERVAARAASELQVPPSVLLATARRESHWGCRGGHSWGAPHSRSHRFGIGTPMDAARALEHSFRVCGTWIGAVGRFRSGLCRPWQHEHREYVRAVVRDVEAIHERTGEPLPEAWR